MQFNNLMEGASKELRKKQAQATLMRSPLRKALKKYVWKRAKEKSQSSNTPCILNPILDDIGFMGTTDSCDKILQGNYTCPRNSHPYAQEFFNQF